MAEFEEKMIHFKVVKSIKRPRSSHHQGRKFNLGLSGLAEVGAARVAKQGGALGGPLHVGPGGVTLSTTVSRPLSSTVAAVGGEATFPDGRAPPPPDRSPASDSPASPRGVEGLAPLPPSVQNFFDSAGGSIIAKGGLFDSSQDSSNDSIKGLSEEELLARLEALSEPPPSRLSS